MSSGYQMARMTQAQRDRRDELVLQILRAARALHKERLVRFSDLMVYQDEAGPRGESSTNIMERGFFARHAENDYRLEVTLLVRATDRCSKS